MTEGMKTAEASIKDLHRRMTAGEITEAEFREQSIPLARVIADAREAGAARFRQQLATVADFLETRPKLVREITAGIVIGLNESGVDLSSWRAGS